MARSKTAAAHAWRFYRAGGVDQVQLDTGADIVNLGQLDQKLWVALSCPTKGLEFDEKTLAFLDTDKDGRVRAPEIIAAVEWLGEVLKNPDELVDGPGPLPLASINDATPEGKLLLSAAKRVLAGLKKDKETLISVGDTTQTGVLFAQARLNGDGIMPADGVEDAAAQKVAAEIIDVLGGEMDRSGKPGINQAKIDAFFAECAAYSDWQKKAEAEGKKVLVVGSDTAAAFDALQAVRAKLDDYFGRSRLAAYDSRAQSALNREESAYLDIASKDLSISAQEVAGLPLAHIEADRPLSLDKGVNPAWMAPLARFKAACVAPILGKDKSSVTEGEWLDLSGRFAGYEGWIKTKAGAVVEKLGIARIREILASKAKESLTKAVADDAAVEPEIKAITDVEKLARFYRDIHKLLKNFVSFTDFYARDKAVFQAGTLYLDGRSCDLCVRVDDGGKHAALAGLAKAYLAYCDLTRPGSNESMTIAAAFTAGDSDYLMVGRNGIFYDRKGRDWDATITKIIDNPISVRQAFFSPYKKLVRFIESAVAKRAAAADDAATSKLTAGATAVGQAAASGKPKFDVGVVAALGVGVGAITAAMGGLMEAFFGLGKWIPLGIVGLILVISGPAMLIAWMKLRQRNLGPILDANGWAVNGRVKVNVPLGGSLTSIAALPPGSARSLIDPYAPKKSVWPKVLLIAVVLIALLIAFCEFGLKSVNADWKVKYDDMKHAVMPWTKPEAK